MPLHKLLKQDKTIYYKFFHCQSMQFEKKYAKIIMKLSQPDEQARCAI